MFATRFLFFTLALLVALVTAVPTPPHVKIMRLRRSTCPKKPTTAVPPATTLPIIVPTSTPSSSSVAVPSSASSSAPTSEAVSSSTVAPSSSSIPSSSVAPSSSVVPTQSIVPSSSSSAIPSSSPVTSSPASSSAPATTSVTPSSSSAVPAQPTSVNPGVLGQLFPVQGFGNRAWSTTDVLGNALALSDSTFRPRNVLRSVVHSYTNAPDGKRAMRAFYPRGSYTFGFQPQGGFSFYAPGPASVDLTTAKEATFSYSVFFPQGFGFQLGGKLPGLYGGNSDGEAVGCSGGRKSSSCFSARLMWRADGEGEFYAYLPPYTDARFAANNKLCSGPGNHCNPTYGASVGRGSFRFATGAWTTVSERVRLNDVGQANGELELFVNGKSVVNISGLILRDSGAGRIRGMQMQTFFGGSKPEFASPKDQEVFFSDFSVAITQRL
ncbi:alginate lyase [Coprinopsis cinerea okayama7|uniref:Alginate lyase n=1 Tax=Coprinopsis cinerea (strain Okayama-7 / 130 / ATCC MYA-4618 / FGSC 9003) TaxID=240176 RepID=A8PA10_COPC7|nr:alginate lyase [Coprinopsis cinerea okayama7\|eukprot:XP_001839878.1 alginate lyase [Coprinopsis cinerea okayama7\